MIGYIKLHHILRIIHYAISCHTMHNTPIAENPFHYLYKSCDASLNALNWLWFNWTHVTLYPCLHYTSTYTVYKVISVAYCYCCRLALITFSAYTCKLNLPSLSWSSIDIVMTLRAWIDLDYYIWTHESDSDSSDGTCWTNDDTTFIPPVEIKITAPGYLILLTDLWQHID